ncbi:MAG: IS1595 family transposase [Gammaproteobacteria bacterium]|nr:IS1595 family transposase [Gammaproteobacteria bacterium]
MNRIAFNQLLSSLSHLTNLQKKKIVEKIEIGDVNECISLIERHSGCDKNCPHCKSNSVSRWGQSGSLQRYRCKSCLKTFNSLTGSPLAGLHRREQWLKHSQCLIDGLSIQKTADVCGIDPTTAFRWRHRFLTTPTLVEPKKMRGIAEVDEIFFTESSKGNKALTQRKPRKRGKNNHKNRHMRVPVLLALDRNGTIADFVFKTIDNESIKSCLRPLMSKEVILCTDGNLIYRTFAQEEGLEHKRLVGVSGIRVIDEIFHIQNLNAYVSRLRQWMSRFKGVSTKYLSNYLGWRRLLEGENESMNSRKCLLATL